MVGLRVEKIGLSLALVLAFACTEDGEGLSTSLGVETGTSDSFGGDGDGDASGDGDGDPSGDGDGDASGDGDGDPSTSGDGDGDPTTTGDGDGDGDPTTTGDGDGDPTTTGDGDGDPQPNPCASNGMGGAVGQAEILAPGYPNLPGTIHVPPSYDPGEAMPLMLALHGSGDTDQNFVNLWDDLANSEGFIVLVPESMSGGASWNAGTDTPLIAELLDEVETNWNIDTCRVYLTGYSAGAHYGYALGLANAEYFAAIGAQAGTLGYAQQIGVWPNQVTREIAVTIHHGTNDQVVPIGQAQLSRDMLENAGHVVYYQTHGGGHEVPPGDPPAMWANLANHTNQE